MVTCHSTNSSLPCPAMATAASAPCHWAAQRTWRATSPCRTRWTSQATRRTRPMSRPPLTCHRQRTTHIACRCPAAARRRPPPHRTHSPPPATHRPIAVAPTPTLTIPCSAARHLQTTCKSAGVNMQSDIYIGKLNVDVYFSSSIYNFVHKEKLF